MARAVGPTAKALFVFALLGLSSSAPSNSASNGELPAEPTFGDVFQLAFKKDCPLGAVRVAEVLATKGHLPGGFMAQLMTLVGADPAIAPTAGRVPPENCQSGGGETSHVAALPALIEMVERTGSRVVMLNESHATQMHRAFAYLMVDALRVRGFSAIGGETFTKNVAATLANGSPDTGTGVYTVDPVFAETLRLAHRKGMVLFGYDFEEDTGLLPPSASVADSENARSAGQARRVAEYLAAHPNAKVLLLSGSGHGSKIEERGIRRVALRLVEDFDTPVFSIDQVFGTPSGGAYRVHGTCFATLDLDLAEPSIVLRDGVPVARTGFDVTVFHPETTLEDGRPSWVTLSGARQLIPVELEASSRRTLLRAYYADETKGAIAADQILIPAGATRGVLALANDEFRFVREDEACLQTPLDPPRSNFRGGTPAATR